MRWPRLVSEMQGLSPHHAHVSFDPTDVQPRAYICNVVTTTTKCQVRKASPITSNHVQNSSWFLYSYNLQLHSTDMHSQQASIGNAVIMASIGGARFVHTSYSKDSTDVQPKACICNMVTTTTKCQVHKICPITSNRVQDFAWFLYFMVCESTDMHSQCASIGNAVITTSVRGARFVRLCPFHMSFNPSDVHPKRTFAIRWPLVSDAQDLTSPFQSRPTSLFICRLTPQICIIGKYKLRPGPFLAQYIRDGTSAT